MKQIGNLAVVCARRQDVLLQVGSEKVCVHVGAGPERNTLHAAWDDDDAIQRIVHELNFGRYAAGRNGCIPHSRIALWGEERRKSHDQKSESAAQDTSGRDAVGDIGSLPAGMYWADTEHYAGKHAGLL